MQQDQRWLAKLYEEDRKSLLLTAWNIVRDVDLAEDILQSVFLRLTKRKDIPDGPRLFAFACVRNAAIDQLRAASARPASRQLDSLASASVSNDEEHSYIETEFLDFALEQLESAEREIVELHLHSCLTFREIGQLTHTPTATVATKYRRALGKIRENSKETKYERTRG